LKTYTWELLKRLFGIGDFEICECRLSKTEHIQFQCDEIENEADAKANKLKGNIKGRSPDKREELRQRAAQVLLEFQDAMANCKKTAKD
jgi:hypothetical protein